MALNLAAILSLKDDFSAKIKTAGGAADSFGSTIKNVGGSSAGAIGLISTGFTGMAGTAKSAFGLLTGNYNELGNMLGQLPGPVGIVGKAIGDSLGAAMDETVKYTEAMRKASVTTGASVSFISQFTEAADDQFISQEKVTTALGKFSKGLGGVQDMEGGFTQSGKGVAQVLDDMGIKATDSTGKMLPMEALIPQLADKFQAMGPGVKATALAVQLFGKSGADLLPVLLQGSAAMKASMDAAAAMGLSIDKNAVTAVTRLKKAQDELADSSTAMGRKISLAVIPALADEVQYLNSLSDWTAFSAYQTEHSFNPTAVKQREVLEQLTSITVGATEGFAKFAPAVADAATAADAAAKATNPMIDNLSFLGKLKANEQIEADAVATWKMESAATAAAAAAKELSDRTNDVIGSITSQTEVMGEAEQTQTIMELATGKLSAAQFETETATKAVMRALKDGKITQLDAVRAMKGLSDGTITARDAMSMAGHSADQLKGQMTYMEQVVAAAGRDVGTLAANMNALPADKKSNLTITGSVDGSFYNAKDTFNNVYGNTVTKTFDGYKTGNFNNAYSAYGSVVNGSATVTYNFDATLKLSGYGMSAMLGAPASGTMLGVGRNASVAGAPSSNTNMSFSNQFGDASMAARRTAAMVRSAQAAATRGALLRAAIGA